MASNQRVSAQHVATHTATKAAGAAGSAIRANSVKSPGASVASTRFLSADDPVLGTI